MKSEISGGNIKRRKAWVTKRYVLKHSLSVSLLPPLLIRGLLNHSTTDKRQGHNRKKSKKPAQVSLSGLLKYGSSDWTRTSDIRINSPPFYRLNYRGIVGTGRIISSRAGEVKG